MICDPDNCRSPPPDNGQKMAEMGSSVKFEGDFYEMNIATQPSLFLQIACFLLKSNMPDGSRLLLFRELISCRHNNMADWSLPA